MDVILNDNNKMPSLGFGTWHLAGEKGIEVFKTAIKLGLIQQKHTVMRANLVLL